MPPTQGPAQAQQGRLRGRQTYPDGTSGSRFRQPEAAPRGLSLGLDAGVVLENVALVEVELDAPPSRMLGVFTAPAGNLYTLVLQRGTELVRRSPVQVLLNTTVARDP